MKLLYLREVRLGFENLFVANLSILLSFRRLVTFHPTLWWLLILLRFKKEPRNDVLNRKSIST
jgi:hypothetical protein